MPALPTPNPDALKNAGIGEAEAGQVLADAKTVYYGQVLRGMGIPAVSLKKYLAAGFTTPDAFCELKPETLSERTGMSLGDRPETCCAGLQGAGQTGPKKAPKLQIERGSKELLTIRGVTEAVAEKLILAGVTEREIAPCRGSGGGGEGVAVLPEQKIRDWQALFRKKKDIIQL